MKRISAFVFIKKRFLVSIALVAFFCAGLASLSAKDLSDKEYIIGPEDVLEIQVWDNEDLNCVTEVSLEGAFTFPLIGRVQADGLSVSRLENLIEERLGDGYLVSPYVNISIKEYNSQKVFIFGAVNKPGSYALKRKTDILELISQAGGFTDKAGQIITIVRTTSVAPYGDNQSIAPLSSPSRGGDVAANARLNTEGNGEVSFKKKFSQSNAGLQDEHYTHSGKETGNEVCTLDLSDFKANSAYNNFYVKNGDSIYVNMAPQIFVSGEVKKPGEFPWEKGLTVRQAISRAGGPTDKASPRRVIITRMETGKEKELKPRMDDPVAPGDVIKVPARYF
jgi:polysaccharide export outer membrane protein